MNPYSNVLCSDCLPWDSRQYFEKIDDEKILFARKCIFGHSLEQKKFIAYTKTETKLVLYFELGKIIKALTIILQPGSYFGVPDLEDEQLLSYDEFYKSI